MWNLIIRCLPFSATRILARHMKGELQDQGPVTEYRSSKQRNTAANQGHPMVLVSYELTVYPVALSSRALRELRINSRPRTDGRGMPLLPPAMQGSRNFAIVIPCPPCGSWYPSSYPMRFPAQREQTVTVAAVDQYFAGTCEFRVEQLFLGGNGASFADHLHHLHVIGMHPSFGTTKPLTL